jgi:hypothetical protein
LRLIATQVFDDKSIMGLGASSVRIPEMQMPNQNTKFVSAVFAGVLAGANFIPALSSPAHADDNCLATPNEQTPQGSHWYYRIERGTKRHCWYLREGSDTHAQSAAVTPDPPPAPANPAPPKAEAGMQGSVANARAELPWPQSRSAPETPAATGQVPAAASANAPSSERNQPSTSTAADANMPQTTIASRWPDQLNASASDDSTSAADNPDASSQPDTVSAAPPVAAAVPLATADTPPSNKQPGSIQMLLTIIIAALALAGVIGGAILRFGGRKRDEDEIDIDRRPIWDIERSDRPLPYPAAAVHRPNIGLPRELRPVEPDDKITEMLARLARSAQT